MDEYYESITECALDDRLLHVEYYDGTLCGRRPAGLARPRPCAGDATARWLATAAHLEAASVPAFERLAGELADHGAPRRLVAAARAAARDEVRHAARLGALAIARGVRPAPVVVRPRRARSLAAIAVENAVEGCVRESYGAIVARRQAAAARDGEVRAAMARIAPDEARHAVLAHAIDAWATPRLTSANRRRVAAARRAAVVELRAALVAPVPPRARAALGLPSPADAARMLDAYANLTAYTGGR
jgi:rubrerythrin